MSAREYYHHVMWYTVWDAKTGELVAAGTSAMCAAKLGYKNAVSFSAAVCHWFKDGKKHLKYIHQREYIPRSEVDSLIPPAPHRHKKRPARAPTRTSPNGDGFSTPHHPEE